MTNLELSDLPPRQRLARVVRALTRRLPAEFAGLLEHPRFADGRAALARLSAEGHGEGLLAALDEQEASFLADLLFSRWSAVGDAALDPEAAIVAPSEVWVGVEPVRLAVEVVVVGAEPGWEAVWDSAEPIGPGRAIMTIEPSASSASCRVHVRARAGGERLSLTAVTRVRVRHPVVTVREDRRRLVVLDRAGDAAVGVTLAVGEAELVTGPGGLVELEFAAPRGALLKVEGIPAGRIAHDDG